MPLPILIRGSHGRRRLLSTHLLGHQPQGISLFINDDPQHSVCSVGLANLLHTVQARYLHSLHTIGEQSHIALPFLLDVQDELLTFLELLPLRVPHAGPAGACFIQGIQPASSARLSACIDETVSMELQEV